MQSTFYSKFVGLTGAELDREFPSPGTIPEDALGEVEQNLFKLDEHHLSYAITLLAHHAPCRLLPHLTLLLADSRTGVWTAAERSVLLLPPDTITDEFKKSLLSAIGQRGGAGQSWLCHKLMKL